MPSYPKDFIETWDRQVNHGLCFGIMPFARAFDRVWRIVRSTVEKEPFNFTCVRADDVAKPGNIMEDVLEYIAKAQLVIADLTGRNANVFYELGIAHSCKPSLDVVLLAQTIKDVPFDLRPLRHIVYKPNLSDLSKELSKTLSESQGGVYRIRVKEGDRVCFPARLTGTDLCLYDIQILADFLGDDSVKLRFVTTRYKAGHKPKVGRPSRSWNLGTQQPELKLPKLAWTLRYGGGSRKKATILLVQQASGRA